jgi:hypothetical protein
MVHDLLKWSFFGHVHNFLNVAMKVTHSMMHEVLRKRTTSVSHTISRNPHIQIKKCCGPSMYYKVDNIQRKQITSVSQIYDSNLTWNYFPVPSRLVDVFWQPLSCSKMSDLRYSVLCATCSVFFFLQSGLWHLFGENALSGSCSFSTTFSKFPEIKRMIYTDTSLIDYIHPT